MKPLVRALVVFGLAILCAAPALAQDRSRPVAYNVLYGTETERNRRLDVYVPEGAEPPYPVVLAFHGSGTTDKSDIAEFGIPQIAAQAGAAIVPVTYTATDPESAYVDAYCALAWVQANGWTPRALSRSVTRMADCRRRCWPSSKTHPGCLLIARGLRRT
jgi:acetyl esterase/lipase